MAELSQAGPAKPGQASPARSGLASQAGPGQEASRLAGPGPGAPGRPTVFLTVEKKVGSNFFLTVEKQVGPNFFFNCQKKRWPILAGPEGPKGHFAFFGWAGIARKAILRFSTLPTFFLTPEQKRLFFDS